MRKPEYLSPSSLACYEKNPAEYYLRYLADVRPPKIQQTIHMAVGSSFDAHVKSYLHHALFGKGHKEASKYELKALFEAQVEPHCRDRAWEDGAYVFRQYQESGALADMMLELNQAVDEPRFEFEVKGEVNGYREGVTKKKMGVVLMGKPDIRFINSMGAHVIWDWKVNGFYAKGNTSPMAGYVQIREQNDICWMRVGAHKDALVSKYQGMSINVNNYLEAYNKEWAAQLCTYSWLMGEDVGAETLTGIDQIVGHGGKRILGKWPTLRVASHRIRVSEAFQFDVMARYQDLWSLIHSEPFYFFRDMSFEDSKRKCELLDKQSTAMANMAADSVESWIYEQARSA